MGKEPLSDEEEETTACRSIETELSFSRWTANYDVELTHRKVPAPLQSSDGQDKNFDSPGSDPREIHSPRDFALDLRRRGAEHLGEWTDRTEWDDYSTERDLEVAILVGENRQTNDEPREDFYFHESRNGGVVSDEDFERDFGFAGSSQSESEKLLDRRSSESSRGWRSPRERKDSGLGVSTADSHANELNDSSGRQRNKEIEEETSRASSERSMLRSILRTLLFVLIWYTFSTSLTLYNKVLLGSDQGKFPAPLLMNTIHFFMQAVVSTLMLRYCCHSLMPTVRMSWKDYFLRVFPTAVATATDIDLSNVSFVFITVTFATMCKSAAPVFLLLFAFLFKLETPSFKLLGIIAIISSGVLLAVAKETQFNLLGFVLVMLATVMSGFRWTVMQILLQKEEHGLNNPFAAMSYLTPIMAVVTCIFSLASEPWHKLHKTTYFDTPAHIFGSALLMLLGGSLAFFMVLTEYILISETSALTMTVAGIVKEVVTIVVAVFFFHDSFTFLKGVGLVIIIIGVSLFNWYKYNNIMDSKQRDHNWPSQIDIKQAAVQYTILTDKSNGEVELCETEEVI